MISKELEGELYSFIVDSNLEDSVINQCKASEQVKDELKHWLQVEKCP